MNERELERMEERADAAELYVHSQFLTFSIIIIIIKFINEKIRVTLCENSAGGLYALLCFTLVEFLCIS